MKIAIDIDNTLTDIQDEIFNSALTYAKSLNKEIHLEIPLEDKDNDGQIYQKVFGFTYDELKYFLGTICEDIGKKALPRDNCQKVIKAFHEKGHDIYIITSRDEEFHKDPYLESAKWLKENNIYYDKLIVNARAKDQVCIDNAVDILIDDNLNNCTQFQKLGITALTIGNNQNKYNIPNFNDWQDIYDYFSQNINYNISVKGNIRFKY